MFSLDFEQKIFQRFVKFLSILSWYVVLGIFVVCVIIWYLVIDDWYFVFQILYKFQNTCQNLTFACGNLGKCFMLHHKVHLKVLGFFTLRV